MVFPVTSGVIQQSFYLWFWPRVTKFYQMRLSYETNLCFFSGICDRAGTQQVELGTALIDKYSSLFNYTTHVLIKQQIQRTRKTCGVWLAVETY